MKKKENRSGEKQLHKLKSCPFCGGHSEVVKVILGRGSDVSISWQVVCFDCWIGGHRAENQKMAAKFWNQRFKRKS